MGRVHTRLVALALVAALGVVAGCGDDGDADTAAFCENLLEINQLQPDIPDDASEEEGARLEEEFFEEELVPLGRELEATAPDDLADDVGRVVDQLEEQGPSAFEDPELAERAASVDRRAAEPCDAELVEVTAVEYSFRGVPSEVEAGRVAVILSNDGEELHEFIMFRKKDGVTESFDEILELPEEQAEDKADETGAAFSFPGASGSTTVELEAGDYIAVCFIPQGLTPEALESGEEPSGPPHFTQGMRVEFTVS